MAEQHRQGQTSDLESRDSGDERAPGPGEEPGGAFAPPERRRKRVRTQEVAHLRERAEAFLAGYEEGWAAPLGEREIKRLLHELQVHQVELEIQNEELRQAQLELAASVERFADLYDFAPVGYLSVGLGGQITRGNLAAAALLGVERRRLTGKSFPRFIKSEDLGLFQAVRRRLVITGLTESIELRLNPLDGEPFWARLEIVTRQDPTEGTVLWQVAISNIEPQKRAELIMQRVNEELEQQVERRTEQLTLANRHLVDEIGRRRQAEAELRRREEHLERRVGERTAELAALLSVSRDISSTLEIESVLDIILHELQHVVPYNGCAIFLLSGQVLTLVEYKGPLLRLEVLQAQTTLDESPLLKTVIEGRNPVIIADMLADTPLTVLWRETSGSLQRQLLGRSRAWLGIPMIAQGQAIGLLRLDHTTPGYFTEQHADLVLALANQAAIAVVNARLFRQVQRVAAVEERQRLARELHDSVAQTFYSIALGAHSARAKSGQNKDLVDQRLDQIVELADAGLTEMKALIFDLQAEGLRRDGLVHALQRHVDAIMARNDMTVHVALGAEPDAGLALKEAIYGIAREAIQNVVRHANATELELRLSRADNRLCLEVRDNGRGFDPDAVGAHTLGLRSIRERAAR